VWRHLQELKPLRHDTAAGQPPLFSDDIFMKLSHKLILAPILTAAVALASSQLDTVLLSRAASEAEARFMLDIDRQGDLATAQKQLGELHVDVYRMMVIIGSLEESALTAQRKEVVQRAGKVKSDLQELAGRPEVDAPLRAGIESATRELDTFVKQIDTALDLASIDPNTGVAAMQGADEAYTAVAKSLDDAAHQSSEQAALRTQEASAKAQRTHWLLALFSLLSAAVVVAFVWRMMSRVGEALGEASHFAREIASGNLGASTNTQRSDEIGDLFTALNAMKTSLTHTVSQVRQATDSIGTASAEIASGNQDLSARTEQTASNLEETAASMEQLTSTVRNSADAAQQANQLAASASEIAVRGGQVVGQVVTTMEAINHSSKKISDIIGVIDGIAFQTNILALNAAVEAARAGEQGRGFAVVASEVRSLAQRSAEAAKEIKGLIGTSVDKVEAGSRLVADAGQTMSEIVGSVQRVSDIIGEITAASGEQSDGISQVNVAVSQLDQMTQQNAALVEQSAAAAESLKDQAMKLAQVVQVFRLSSADTPTLVAVAARPPAKALPTPAQAPTKTAVAQRPAVHKPAAPAAMELKRPQLHRPAAAAASPPASQSSKATASAGDDGDWESF
jgi:methyl-accepting chemotaxis protein